MHWIAFAVLCLPLIVCIVDSIHACLAAQYVATEPGKGASAVYVGTHVLAKLCWSVARPDGIILDSEGSFIIERVASMAECFLQDFRQLETQKRVRWSMDSQFRQRHDGVIVLLDRPAIGADTGRFAARDHVLPCARLLGADRSSLLVVGVFSRDSRGKLFDMQAV